MKKIIYSIIFTFFLSSISFVNASFISNSLSIKRVENVSYNDSITVNSNNDSFNVRMNMIPNTDEPNSDFKIILNGLPSNITASGYTINSDTCITKIKNITSQNNTFSYTYTPNGTTPCNAIITTNFITNNTLNGEYSLTYTIQKLSDNSLRTSNNSVKLKVNNLIRIIKATSIDTDIDGFIDGYNITLNQDIGANVIIPGNLIISDNDNTATNIIFTKTGNNTAKISFDDNIFHSGNTPNLNITNIHNSFDSDIYNLGVIEDTASPYLSTINNTVYNGSNITLTSIPSTLELNFLEPIRKTDIAGVNIQLNGTNVTGVHTLNTEKNTLIFTPSSAFTQGNYSVIFNNQIIDIAGNVMGLASASMTLGTPVINNGGGCCSSGGGPSIDNTNYEIEKYLSNTETKISQLKDSENKLAGKLLLDKENILTSTGQTIVLQVNKNSESSVTINENTQIVKYNGEQNGNIYPAIQIEESDIVTSDFILINNKEITINQIGGLYKFNPNLDSESYLSQDITLELVLKKPSTLYPFHIYHFNNLEDGWNPIDTNNYVNDSDNIITFNTNKFGYYIIIQNRYLEENARKISELDGITESENITPSGLTFKNLEDQLNADLQISAIKKLAHKFYLKFAPDMTYFDYFVGFDIQLAKQYNSYAQAHYNMFIALEKYVLTKESSEKTKVVQNLKIIAEAFKAEKDIKTKYITVVNNYFVPNNSVIKNATAGLRTKVEKKLNNLIATNSISQEEYNIGKESYNEFILHLTIFFEYNKYAPARLEALKQAKIFIPIYNKKIIIKNIASDNSEKNIPIIQEPVKTVTENTTVTTTQQIYGDVYYFDNELRFGNYNDDVTHLQKILLREGYFDYATTGYYGEITAQAVKQFSSEKLGLSVTGNIFNREIINGLLAQPMK